MATYLWPGDRGWPEVAADTDLADPADPDGEPDLDVVALHAVGAHLFDDLTPVERHVIAARFGLAGAQVRSMKELHDELGCTRHAVRDVFESGLAKLRIHLTA